jgi:hypothetical protein
MGQSSFVEAMSEPLRSAYRSVRDLLARVSRDDVLGRRQIGAIIVDVKKSPRKYGARAVPQLAEALSVATKLEGDRIEMVEGRPSTGSEEGVWSLGVAQDVANDAAVIAQSAA